ncbi:MAG TPA: PRC-barrel domain-containing protein [Alphaproteobacteria bacterium]|nr:PRC-barrel domain-containing protein [Alphaproteobacteria bacterium]
MRTTLLAGIAALALAAPAMAQDTPNGSIPAGTPNATQGQIGTAAEGTRTAEAPAELPQIIDRLRQAQGDDQAWFKVRDEAKQALRRVHDAAIRKGGQDEIVKKVNEARTRLDETQPQDRERAVQLMTELQQAAQSQGLDIAADAPPPPSAPAGGQQQAGSQQAGGQQQAAGGTGAAQGGAPAPDNKGGMNALADDAAAGNIGQAPVSMEAWERQVGRQLIAPDGVELGEIQDVLADPGGKVVGVIVESGGFLGLGEKTSFIGADRLRFSEGGQLLAYVTREQVEQATRDQPSAEWKSIAAGNK